MVGYLLVFLGGGLGAALRHGVNLAGASLLGTRFPYSTLFANVTGSFVMGLIIAYLAFKDGGGQHWKLFLTTGVLGGYILLHPRSLILTWIAPIFFVPIPAFLYLGIWFVLQIVSGGSLLTSPETGGGVAYFAHIGGFVFGLLTVKLFHAGRSQEHAW